MNCCPKCCFRIYWNDDYVLYNCGHKLHSACLLTTRWSLINPTCSICNMGEIIRYKCSKNERIISRNEKNKKNNVINDKEEVKELDNEFKEEVEEDNGKEESNKGDNEKRLIITNILGVFLIAFTIWKIISM